MNRIILIMLAMVAAVGCNPEDMRLEYELESGDVVQCASEFHRRCGVDLTYCADDQVYLCQQNVRRIR